LILVSVSIKNDVGFTSKIDFLRTFPWTSIENRTIRTGTRCVTIHYITPPLTARILLQVERSFKEASAWRHAVKIEHKKMEFAVCCTGHMVTYGTVDIRPRLAYITKLNSLIISSVSVFSWPIIRRMYHAGAQTVFIATISRLLDT